MERRTNTSPKSAARDLAAAIAVFAVTVPLSLGIAAVSGAPPHAGIISAILGGLLVGALSRSQTGITGPTAGLTAVVAAQIATLGSFEAFLLAVVIAGLIQLALGLGGFGLIADYVPISVIKGLLSAVGLILILKQLPHLVGHDVDPEGEMSFVQPDHKNTFSELADVFRDYHIGAMVIGLSSLALLFLLSRSKFLRRRRIPAAPFVVLYGVALNLLFGNLGGQWLIEGNHVVQLPAAPGGSFRGFLALPDFSQWTNTAVYSAAILIAAVASLETLMNSEAMDTIDPRQRKTPPNHELAVQGIGNLAAGFLGGIPMTSVTVLGSVGLYAGGHSRKSAILQGALLLLLIPLVPGLFGLIPVSCLAAVLFWTGVQLVGPARIRRMWNGGRYQFAPFAITVAAIVLTDLLVGVLIGLAVSLGFIINSNLRRPIRRFVEKHLGGNVIHFELANQVSFLNRPTLSRALDSVPAGSQVLLDAQQTDFIDPDVLHLIRNFTERVAPERGISVSLRGFRSKYRLGDRIQYVDHATRELQELLTPAKVLQLLREGNERFRTGHQLTRDLNRQVVETAQGQHPLAVVLSCMDSRSTAELIFDLGVGDVFGVRVAGNILSRKVLGSMEYGCAVAGAKLILVMGHTRCGAVTSAVKLAGEPEPVAEATGCQHVEHVLTTIQESVDIDRWRALADAPQADKQLFIDDVARANVMRMVDRIGRESRTLNGLIETGDIAVVGAVYDVSTGVVEFLSETFPTDERDPRGSFMAVNFLGSDR
jgi:carbonic anhydrase/SulP family sulfate permease